MSIKNIITRSEFDKILVDYSYGGILKRNEKDVLYQFLISQNITTNQLKAIFNGAKKYAITVQKDNSFVKPSEIKILIMDMCKTQDYRIYEQFDAIDKELKSYYRENDLTYPKGLDKIIKNLYAKAKEISLKDNTEFKNFSDKAFNFIRTFACLYSSLAHFLKDEANRDVKFKENGEEQFLSMLDYLMLKRILSVKKLENFDIDKMESFKEFLEELTNGRNVDANELFSGVDLAKLLNKTASIIDGVSRDKLIEIRIIMKNYFAHVVELAQKEESVNLEKIREFTTKDLFLRGGSVLIRDPRNLKDATSLLLGVPIREILIDREISGERMSKAIDSLQLNFPNMRLTGMDSNKHINILDNNTSIFTTLHLENVNSVATSVAENIFGALDLRDADLSLKEKVEKLREAGFDMDYFITGDNINELFMQETIKEFSKKGVLYQNLNQNVKILKSFLQVKDIQQVFAHNFNFMLQDSYKLLESVKSIIAKSGTSEKLSKNLEILLNSEMAYNSQNEKLRKNNTDTQKVKKVKQERTDAVVEDKKAEIKIESLNLDVANLNKFGVSIPLDLSVSESVGAKRQTSKRTTIELKNEKETKIEKKQNDKKTEEIGKIIEGKTQINVPRQVKTKEVYVEMIYQDLEEISNLLNDFLTVRNGNKTVSSQIQTKINSLDFKIKRLNSLISINDIKIVREIKSVLHSYINMIEKVAPDLEEQVNSEKELAKSLIVDLRKRKARKRASISYPEEIKQRLQQVLNEYNIPKNATKVELDQISEASQIALVEDEEYRAETRAEKVLLNEATTKYGSKNRVKHSLDKMKDSLKSFGEMGVDELTKHKEKLMQEKNVIIKQISDIEGLIKNKQASMRGRYTKEHIMDENYSMEFLFRLRTAIKKLEDEKSELFKKQQIIDDKLKEIEDLLKQINDDFAV